MDAKKDTLYARWLAGALSPAEEAKLKSSGELEELESLINSVDQLSLPKYDVEAGYARFKTNNSTKKTAKVSKLKKRRIWPILAAAASVLVLVIAIQFFRNDANLIETENGQTLAYSFEDRSSIILNDGSKLIYNDAEWEEKRVVELTGEAFFTVSKGVPFTVQTTNGIIEVLGTRFNVRTWGGKLYVECYEGSVSVQSKNQAIILTATKAVNVVNGQLQEQTISHEKPLWTTGNSRFYSETTDQVLAELERQFDVNIKRPKIVKPFSGNFQHNDLEAALKAVCKPMSLNYSISTNGKEVTITQN